MSELISGKEALIALANGEEVEFDTGVGTWHLAHKGLTLHCFDSYKFRLKPRTIMIGNIEVPAPFDPKDGEKYFYLNNRSFFGFGCREYSQEDDDLLTQFGAWRTE